MVLERAPEAQIEALADDAEVYVANAFGQRLDLVRVTPQGLPHFLTDRYAIWRGSLKGHGVLLMAIREIQPPGAGATTQYLKHRELVRERVGADLVLLLLGRAPSALRRQMVERKIGFIVPGSQLYVPEAFLDLRERAPSLATFHSEQVSPTAQLVLLANLQGTALNDRNLTELADKFGVSIMSMSRALDELEALSLAKAYIVGRQRRLRMLMTGRELWNEVQMRLQSPVRKVRTVNTTEGEKIGPLAGESALAHYTMLASPQVETRAIHATSWKHAETTYELGPATVFDENRVEVQTWTYDPRILAQGNVIDRLSLYLTVRSNPDERVSQAAEELLEALEW